MSNIPTNIEGEHVVKAINEINKNGVESGREADGILVEYGGIYYPPKYVVSLANKYPNKKELKAVLFHTNDTYQFFSNLGFGMVEYTEV